MLTRQFCPNPPKFFPSQSATRMTQNTTAATFWYYRPYLDPQSYQVAAWWLVISNELVPSLQTSLERFGIPEFVQMQGAALCKG